jgi:hypothetical protein
LRSACMPAPPPLSEPAMVRATGRFLIADIWPLSRVARLVSRLTVGKSGKQPNVKLGR